MQQEKFIYVDKDGNKFYYKDCLMKIRHHLDGPAIDYTSGTKLWFVGGKLHRLDGPAVEWADGSNLWYVGGKLHRLDGPAIQWANGSGEWFVSGKRHRLNGPAVELANGSRGWWVNGEELTEEQFNALNAPPIELTLPLETMTPEKQRIEIAKACGWQWARLVHQEGLADDFRGFPPNTVTVGTNERYLPDYLNDLNAMHEAEKKLIGSRQKVTYLDELMKILGYPTFDSVHATAAQRAEAFLKTLNLWTK